MNEESKEHPTACKKETELRIRRKLKGGVNPYWMNKDGLD